MILYKNVDICDLDSILKNGILSFEESKNNNWNEGKRANNPTDRVYLFQPVENKPNSFPKYGVALLEVVVDNAEKSEFCNNDIHKEDYVEFTVSVVEPDKIKKIIIPDIFRERLHLTRDVEKRVEWCRIYAKFYDNNFNLIDAGTNILEMFAKTEEIECSNCFNFFRGTDENRRIIDLYEIKYIF